MGSGFEPRSGASSPQGVLPFAIGAPTSTSGGRGWGGPPGPPFGRGGKQFGGGGAPGPGQTPPGPGKGGYPSLPGGGACGARAGVLGGPGREKGPPQDGGRPSGNPHPRGSFRPPGFPPPGYSFFPKGFSSPFLFFWFFRLVARRPPPSKTPGVRQGDAPGGGGPGGGPLRAGPGGAPGVSPPGRPSGANPRGKNLGEANQPPQTHLGTMTTPRRGRGPFGPPGGKQPGGAPVHVIGGKKSGPPGSPLLTPRGL